MKNESERKVRETILKNWSGELFLIHSKKLKEQYLFIDTLFSRSRKYFPLININKKERGNLNYNKQNLGSFTLFQHQLKF